MIRWVWICAWLVSSVARAQLPTAEVTAPAPEPTHYRLGLITAITVPQPLSVGVLAVPSYNPDLAFFAEGGYFRFGLGNSRAINDWSLSGGIRYRPFSNWFLLGLNFGYRHFGATADISSLSVDGTPLASRANLSLNALFFGLFVGGQWKLSEKVDFGVDLGLQLAALPWGDVNIEKSANTTDDTDLTVDAADSMRRVAALPIPQVALFRFIWYL